MTFCFPWVQTVRQLHFNSKLLSHLWFVKLLCSCSPQQDNIYIKKLAGWNKIFRKGSNFYMSLSKDCKFNCGWNKWRWTIDRHLSAWLGPDSVAWGVWGAESFILPCFLSSFLQCSDATGQSQPGLTKNHYFETFILNNQPYDWRSMDRCWADRCYGAQLLEENELLRLR